MYSGGAGYIYLARPDRNQANVVALQVRRQGRSATTSSSGWRSSGARSATAPVPNGVYFYDYGGSRTYAYGYCYDLRARTSASRSTRRTTGRSAALTLNLGLRADNITGTDQQTGNKLYSAFSVGPRLGFAYDVSGKGTSVVRGFYGQLYEAAVFSSWSKATTGLTPTNYYWVGNADGEPSTIQDWSPSTFVLYDTVARSYKVGQNLSHPRVDEFNLSFEHQFARTYKITATGIWRDWKNFINATLDNAQWNAFTYTPAVSTFPGAPPVAPLTLYKWANPTSVPDFTIGNTDSVSYNGAPSATGYRKYRGMMLIFERAFKDRWQARVSYVLSKTTGSINNSTYAGISSNQFETPNTAVVNVDGESGYDRRHEVKIFAGYQIPKIEVSVNGSWRYLSGTPYTLYARISGGTFGWPNSINVNLLPLDSYHLPNETNTDIRFEKVFTYQHPPVRGVRGPAEPVQPADGVLGADAYPYRTLSYHDPADTADPSSLTDVKVPFGAPLTVSPSRQAIIGLRWSF